MAVCKGNLRQLGLALNLYHDTYGSFPPAYVTDASGTPAHSWRVLLLPQLGEHELYAAYRFDEPWNGPHNRELLARMPAVYACPEHQAPESGITRYVAIVGKETIWPEQYAAALHDVRDGSSNTIQLVEWSDSDIAWLEPRDIRYADREQTLARIAHPPGETDGFQHVLMADGAIRSIRTQIDRKTYRWLQTINSGLPLPGVAWPVDESLQQHDFGSIRPAEAFAQTEVVPVLNAPVGDGRNVVWCATFQMAWDDLRGVLNGAPVELQGAPPLAAALNAESYDRAALAPETYVARGGRQSQGIVEDILREMAVRFPAVQPQLLNPRPSPNAVVLYCYLLKVLPFAEHYQRLTEPLSFQSGENTVSVAAFGLTENPGDGFDKRAISRQISVLDYAGPDDFILQLATANARDVIVLAKVEPSTTLSESLMQVRRRIDESPLTPAQRTFRMRETLAVPVLTLNVDRRYEELIGRDFLNPETSDLFIDRAAQIIRFRLDERGAHLVSEVEIIGENGHGAPVALDEPRRFIFDRPFLIYLQEAGTSTPYFAAWIGNTELMEPE